jgi:hypothetical protein
MLAPPRFANSVQCASWLKAHPINRHRPRHPPHLPRSPASTADFSTSSTSRRTLTATAQGRGVGGRQVEERRAQDPARAGSLELRSLRRSVLLPDAGQHRLEPRMPTQWIEGVLDLEQAHLPGALLGAMWTKAVWKAETGRCEDMASRVISTLRASASRPARARAQPRTASASGRVPSGSSRWIAAMAPSWSPA